MPKKRFSAEQIVVLLRQIDVAMSQGNVTGSHRCWSTQAGRWAVIEFSESGAVRG